MHPELAGKLPSLAEYLHIVRCDECEAKYGDAVLAYGQALILAASALQASS